jgi:hypothetical protein
MGWRSLGACIATGLATALVPAACYDSACTNGRITTDALPDATVGQPYSFQIKQSCGANAGTSWQLGDPAPPGIEITYDGKLLGTPTAAGTYSLQVSVSFSVRGPDSTSFPGGADSRAYSFIVRP